MQELSIFRTVSKMKKYDLEILIGYNCNNNCIFCSNQSLRRQYSKSFPPSLNYIKRILKSHKKKKIDNLFFVGGEPTIRNDFLDIIRYAKALGYNNIFVVTNGRLLSYLPFAKALCNEHVKLSFSIHGDNKKIHETLTRTKNSFEQLKNGMNNVKNLGEQFTTNTVINKLNYTKIPQIIKFLAKYNPELMLFSLASTVGVSEDNLNKIVFDLKKLRDKIESSVGMAEKFNQRIQFADIPLCIMKGFEEYMYEKYFTVDRKVLVRGFKDLFYLEYKNKNEKIKPLICSKCDRNKDCNGLWKGYFKVYGNTALTPLCTSL